MEAIVSVFLFVLLAIIVLKILAVAFHVGIFMLTLPIKLLGLIIALILVPIIVVPLGLLTGLAGLILIPVAFLVPLLPFLLILIGIIALLRNN